MLAVSVSLLFCSLVFAAQSGPPPLPQLPKTPDEVTDIALANNSDLAAIAAQVRAAGLDVRVAQSDRLPSLSAIAYGRHTDYLGSADTQFGPGAADSTTSTGVGIQASIPLYQGGLVGARVRQSQAIQSQLLEAAYPGAAVAAPPTVEVICRLHSP